MKTKNHEIEKKQQKEEMYILEYQIIEGIDTLEPLDVAEDLYWTDHRLPFEEALMQATIMDRHYLIIDEKHNIIGWDFYDKGRDVNEYYQLMYPEMEYEWMKYEIDIVDDLEWECIMGEEMEHYDSLRTNSIVVYESNPEELTKILQIPLDETTYEKLIHFNYGGIKFIITVTNRIQFHWYKVQSESANGILKYIWSGFYPEYILNFIDYFLETGLTLDELIRMDP